jgi:hypothetical protein
MSTQNPLFVGHSGPMTPTAWEGFEQMTSAAPPARLIWRSFGPEKTGKTHFGLTGPGPVAVLSFDVGLEGVVEKFVAAGKVVYLAEFEFDKDKCQQADAVEIRDRFTKAYALALDRARTIIIDTETELWELFRHAEFPFGTDAPKNYVQLNARYRDMIQLAYDAGVNLQLIQKVKEKWGTIKKINSQGREVDSPYPTGELEPTGFKELGYIVQANLRHGWTKERGFVVDVVNCRQNMQYAGVSLDAASMPSQTAPTLPELGQLIFPTSTPEQWA